MILKALCSARPNTWAVTKIHAKLSGDLNVQIKGPGKLRLYFLPNLYWLLEKEIAETTNSIQFF